MLTSAYPITPTPKPDQIAQLLKRNAELEDEVRALRSRVSDVEEEQNEQDCRVADLEDRLDDATSSIVDLKQRIDAVSAGQDQTTTRIQGLPALEAKVVALESGLAAQQATSDQFQVQVKQQMSENTIGLDSLSADVEELYGTVHDEEGSDLMQTLAKLNEDFEHKMKDWVEWTESLHRRVSRLEKCDEDDDWVDADLK